MKNVIKLLIIIGLLPFVLNIVFAEWIKEGNYEVLAMDSLANIKEYNIEKDGNFLFVSSRYDTSIKKFDFNSGNLITRTKLLNNNYFLSKDSKTIIYYNLHQLGQFDRTFIIDYGIYGIFPDSLILNISDTSNALSGSFDSFSFREIIQNSLNFISVSKKLFSNIIYDASTMNGPYDSYIVTGLNYEYNFNGQIPIIFRQKGRKILIHSNDNNYRLELTYYSQSNGSTAHYDVNNYNSYKDLKLYSLKDTTFIGSYSYADDHYRTTDSSYKGNFANNFQISRNEKNLILSRKPYLFIYDIEKKSVIDTIFIDYEPSFLESDFSSNRIYSFGQVKNKWFYDVFNSNPLCYQSRVYLDTNIRVISIAKSNLDDYFIINDNNERILKIKIDDTTVPYLSSEFIKTSKNLIYENDNIDIRAIKFCDARSYFWDFGDGETSNLFKVNHTYTKDGVYDIKLILDFGNRKDTIIKYKAITVMNNLKAYFTVDNEVGVMPFKVKVNNLSEGRVVKYTWYLGNYIFAYDSVFNYTYTVPGEYDLRLEVSDGLKKDLYTHPIKIKVIRPDITNVKVIYEKIIGNTPMGFPKGYRNIFDMGNGDLALHNVYGSSGITFINKNGDIINEINNITDDCDSYYLSSYYKNGLLYLPRFYWGKLQIRTYDWNKNENIYLPRNGYVETAENILVDDKKNIYLLTRSEIEKKPFAHISKYDSLFNFKIRNYLSGDYYWCSSDFRNGQIIEDGNFLIASASNYIARFYKSDLYKTDTLVLKIPEGKIYKIKKSNSSSNYYILSDFVENKMRKGKITCCDNKFKVLWEYNSDSSASFFDIDELNNDTFCVVGSQPGTSGIFLLDSKSLKRTEIKLPYRYGIIYALKIIDNDILFTGLVHPSNFPNTSATLYLLKIENPLITNDLQNNNNTNFRIYPNPASEKINIQLLESDLSSKIEIFDVLGNILLNLNTINKDNPINISSFPVGVYFVKITTGANNYNSKFIINRN